MRPDGLSVETFTLTKASGTALPKPAFLADFLGLFRYDVVRPSPVSTIHLVRISSADDTFWLFVGSKLGGAQPIIRRDEELRALQRVGFSVLPQSLNQP